MKNGDLTKKVEVLVQTKTIPTHTRTFSVNTGFAFNEGDQVLFFNYSSRDVTFFIDELNKQNLEELILLN